MSDAPAAHRQNRLAAETSPYLLQHAGNPVDWFPWGEEAFAEARRTDRPILLSVGYSSCHWCHVMAHESFEDEAIAAQMNEWFVNIKVDREERPDIDDVYMTVTQALTGQGGWPMTVFLTPDREPFFAGTYFPPDDAHGRPGFPRVLERIHETWLHDRERVLTSAQTITERLRVASERGAQGDGVLVAPQAAGAVAWFREHVDPTWGGFGGAPKFPAPANLDFLLLHHARAGATEAEPSALELVSRTLHAMADGGIYDHLGGGFHRYSVDAQWLVPHFEKMLYDNAQLAVTYLHAWQLTGEPRFEQVTRETIDYLLREMRGAEGGFYAATDADSEGIEGKYFVWTPEGVRTYLGDEDGALFSRAYGVTPDGNFMDPHHVEFGRRTVLHRAVPIATLAAERGVTADALETHLATLRERLRVARERRVPPALDDKVLTAWNGLALAACAEAGRVLDEPRYLEAAQANAAFVRRTLWRDGRLLHTYRAGVAKVAGLVEDYAQYGLGLIALYRATGELSHLAWAAELLEVLLTHFHDAAGGGFFDAPRDGEALLLRQKPVFDAAVPSGNAAAAQLAYWLGRYYERPDWEAVAHEVLALAQEHMQLAPSGFGALWQVAELLLAPRREIAIVGEAAARRPFERALAQRFVPAMVIAPGLPDGGLPLLAERGREHAAAYVCEDMVCALPALEVAAFHAQLEALVQHTGTDTIGAQR